ncbi:MAG TPA: hypothetical protein VHZ81_05350 [Galbitalea sp.]|jgi:hypothetical protein|nr:hypothetical protein [Galbitalea sp.]
MRLTVSMAMGELAHLGLGLLLAVAYFIAPVFVVGTLSLGVLLWTAFAWFVSYSLGYGLILAMPLWLVGGIVAKFVKRTWIGWLVFFIAGGLSATVGFGIAALGTDGTLDPHSAMALGGGTAIAVVILYAALCSSLGWLTVRIGAKQRPYADALDGHTFEEIAAALEHSDRKVEISSDTTSQ